MLIALYATNVRLSLALAKHQTELHNVQDCTLSFQVQPTATVISLKSPTTLSLSLKRFKS